MKVVAFLPAKGSSNRIRSKNIRFLDGKPLFLHTLEKLIEAKFINEVYLDTESEDIINLADAIDCNIMKRDPKLASNKTDGNILFMNEVKSVDADIYIQILCTSPFIELGTIEKAVNILADGSEHDSCVLIREERLYKWVGGKPQYDIQNIPNSVDLESTYVETMGLYVIKREAAIRTGRRIGDNPFFIKATALEAVDVNFPDDFALAELIAAGKRERARKLWSSIKLGLTSAILSDILDQLDIRGVIPELSSNIPNSKLLGTAKTLKIRRLETGEDPNGIYEALRSYDSIVPHDIIVVDNSIGDYAYFGELNANLAIRSGAAGAIVSGKTRDSKAVRDLNFPVFSKGYTCKDVRNIGTVESINKQIMVGGITIYPNDLIFADDEGVVVIPRGRIADVFERAMKVVLREKQVLTEIARGVTAEELISKFGYF